MNYFIAVNYNTSNLIQEWTENILSFIADANLIVVDNFSSIEERQKVEVLCAKLGVNLIESENIGYSGAINLGIKEAINTQKGQSIKIFAGNLDIIYLNIPKNLPDGKVVYIPRIIEQNRENRNPFLTKIQKKITPLYKIAGRTQSPIIYFLVIAINKLVGFIPSEIWAVHGSLFCFNSKCITEDEEVFNSNSFLYGEELEFASYMEYNNAKFLKSEIIVEHQSHAATKDIVASRKKFLKTWWPSFKNWDRRWNC